MHAGMLILFCTCRVHACRLAFAKHHWHHSEKVRRTRCDHAHGTQLSVHFCTLYQSTYYPANFVWNSHCRVSVPRKTYAISKYALHPWYIVLKYHRKWSYLLFEGCLLLPKWRKDHICIAKTFSIAALRGDAFLCIVFRQPIPLHDALDSLP